MAETTRQTAIFGIEDWKQIYQTYREADFQSYDFETLRKSFIDYLRLYYPETFNDYIESSEFIALLDVMAFMGQALAFRTDLNTRENYIDTAERRDSVTRLANLVSYTAKRNTAASGYLKVFNVSTTENVVDYNGVNLSNVTVDWTDPTNPDWQEQFTAIINAALVDSQRIGRPGNSQTLLGIRTDEYAINLVQGFWPVIPYQASVDGITMPFEAVTSTSQGENFVYEPAPASNTTFNVLFRNDQQGFASADTGYFFLFKQGSLQNQDFNLAERISNRTVNINIEGINNTDRWLFQLDDVGAVNREWQYTENIYATATEQTDTLRPIYSVTSRANDQITLVFGDGVFSEIPVGTFRAYVRASNGLQYIINPEEMQNVVLPISYISRTGNLETITFTCGITRPVANAQSRESIDAIKQRAPGRFYTQNRMVNGEDYNIFPFTAYNSIIKSKAVNRASLGTSRYLDLVDQTGKFSSINLFGTDGGLWRTATSSTILFSYTNRNEIADVITNQVEPLLAAADTQQFYYERFPRQLVNTLVATAATTTATGNLITVASQDLAQFQRLVITGQIALGQIVTFSGTVIGGVTADLPYYVRSLPLGTGSFSISTQPNGTPVSLIQATGAMTTTFQLSTYQSTWSQSTTSANETTGFFRSAALAPVSVGTDSTTVFRYVTVRSLIKFVAPAGSYFDANNRLRTGTPSLPNERLVIWAAPTAITGDGSNGGVGNLRSGVGPVVLNDFVPTGAIVDSIIPIYSTDLPLAIEQEMQQQIILFRDFGLAYDNDGRVTGTAGSWYIITSTNLDATGVWSQVNAGSTVGANLDSSWLVKFIVSNQNYTITFRGISYSFGSVLQNRFYFDGTDQVYDSRTGTTIRDFITVLGTNSQPDSTQPLGADVAMRIIGQPQAADGYVNDYEVLVSFRDRDNDGVPDDPDFFDSIVDPDQDPDSKLIFLQQTTDFDDLERLLLTEPGTVNTDYATLDQLELVKTEWPAGQVFYTADEQQFWVLQATAAGVLTLVSTNQYQAYVGRQALSYQYRHNASLNNRIDPGVTNIIDIYVVTQSYYTAYQNWLRDTTGTVLEPMRPSINELDTAYQGLNDFKMISDNIVLNSVRFKPLFGAKAATNLRGLIKVVKATNTVISDSEVKSSVLAAMNQYFSIDIWNFGDTFYFSELSAYLHRELGSIISSVVLVPLDPGKTFGDLYEIRCQPDEIFANAATINDIQVIVALTSNNLRSQTSVSGLDSSVNQRIIGSGGGNGTITPSPSPSPIPGPYSNGFSGGGFSGNGSSGGGY